MEKDIKEKSGQKSIKKNKASAQASADNIPHGREAVKKAILAATEKLLLERSPHEISIREIARVAKVQHPLIYRHFGTKDNLILAVHAQNIGQIKQAIGKVEDIEGNIKIFFEAVEKNKFRQIALARAMIEGVNPHLLQDQFPVMQYFLELIEKKQSEAGAQPKFEARIVAATISATALGWMLYEPFLLAATGLEGQDIDRIKTVVSEILEEFVRQSY